MARRFIKPKHDRLFRRAVTGLINDLSKKSTFYLVVAGDASPCPNCDLDPVHDTSNNKYNGTGPQPFTGNTCPVCKGDYWIRQTQKRRVREASVQWGRATNDPNLRTPFGDLPQDYARVKMPVRYYDQVRQADHFIVDGDRCVIVGRPERRGLQSKVIVEMLVKRDL